MTIHGSDSHDPMERPDWPVLSRSHEKILFAFYALTGSVFLGFSSSPPFAESAVALTWSSMVLAISFTEAWVKFRAPFLPKPIAVDVGRHVFAAKQSIELGLCGAFWGRRCFCRESIPLLPALATMSLLFEASIVSPKLYLRAKDKIVKELSDGYQWDARAKKELEKLAAEVNRQGFKMPSKVWHSVYGLGEVLKVVCLSLFSWRSWSGVG